MSRSVGGRRTGRSRAAFGRARRILPGGVDSPVRSFVHVGGTPVFVARGRGAYVWDLDGTRYLDLVGAWGAAILGHAPAAVVRAVRRTAERGLAFGLPTPLEHELAERLRGAAPELERLRFVSSGTEAVMSAVRVARGFTGRPKVLKFAGGYHGHSDGLLARAGSGVAAQSLPDSAGVPPSIVSETLVVPYNDLEAVRRAFDAWPDSIAAAVVEPVAGNMGVVPPAEGFLGGLARLCRERGALLIADEVITGFRLRRGTIHAAYGARADLVTLGKVIGGGLPVGAYGGRADVMAAVAPDGPVYQAGTLSGSPLAMAAGAATLDALRPSVYRGLEGIARRLETVLREAAATAGEDRFHLTRVGSMLGLFFGTGTPTDSASALAVDRGRYRRFFAETLDGGVHLPPSPLETAFASAAMRREDIDRVAPTFRRAFAAAAAAPS